MKRVFYFIGVGVLTTLLAGAATAQSDSLAEMARQKRKEKAGQPAASPARVFTNDNLPRTDKLSTVGPEQPATNEQMAEGNASAHADATESEGSAPASTANTPSSSSSAAATADTAKARQAEWGEWRKKISAQKDAVDLLQRELDVQQREYRLRAAAFYADAGNRLRNSAQWDQQDSKYKEQSEEKQKGLDEAKQKLDDMREEARKTGVPASSIE
jgi:hypothetical protein